MAQEYRWRPATRIINGGYPGEDVNTIPANAPWTTTSATSGQSNFQCYYRDSINTVMQDCCSTRVLIKGHDEWTASFDSSNNLKVTVTTVIDSIVRDDKRETCGTIPPRNRNLYDFRIELKRQEGGPTLWNSGDVYVGAQETIGTNINLGSYSFTLAPGQNLQRGSVLVQSWASYFYGNPDPIYYDLIWVGINFENPMPADYRPGAIWNGSEWMSHNRATGTRTIYDGTNWKELRTQQGGTGTGDPPSIVHNDNTYKNMRKLGRE